MLPSSVSLDGFLKTVAADEGSRQNSKLNAQMRTRGLTALVMQRDQTRATKGTGDMFKRPLLLPYAGSFEVFMRFVAEWSHDACDECSAIAQEKLVNSTCNALHLC